jgi:hypothetical protein
MYSYAAIDENGLCVGVSQLAGPVDSPGLIPVSDADCGRVLGMKYDAGQWVVTGAATAEE